MSHLAIKRCVCSGESYYCLANSCHVVLQTFPCQNRLCGRKQTQFSSRCTSVSHGHETALFSVDNVCLGLQLMDTVKTRETEMQNVQW